MGLVEQDVQMGVSGSGEIDPFESRLDRRVAGVEAGPRPVQFGGKRTDGDNSPAPASSKSAGDPENLESVGRWPGRRVERRTMSLDARQCRSVQADDLMAPIE